LKITLAKAMGSCFGVDDAVEMALEHEHAEDLTILGQLVHNPQTVERLKKKGIRLVSSVDALDSIETKYVMVTAHGASNRVKEKVVEQGFILDDATCPLVKHVHKTIKRFVSMGYFPIVIGEAQHVEVKGIVGDLSDYLVISDAKDIEKLSYEKRRRLGIVSQTTQNYNRVGEIAEAIKNHPDVEDVKFFNTVCKPTRQRQEAVEELSDEVDVMIVIGGKNSSNTHKLKLLCDSKGVDAYHIESATELQAQWFDDKQHAGITAGTSTPFNVIDEVFAAIQQLTKPVS
jgi:4-hydroxy-3-methylbut-2-en-1-yl diphosphate reductase